MSAGFLLLLFGFRPILVRQDRISNIVALNTSSIDESFVGMVIEEVKTIE